MQTKIILVMLLALSGLVVAQQENQFSQFNENSNTFMAAGFSASPQIISQSKIAFPIALLKKGIQGKIIVELDIDNKGKVERSFIKEGLHPSLDSIVIKSMFSTVFSPAFEMGKAVASTVNLQLVYSADSLIQESNMSTPKFEGFVLDKDTKTPINGAIINLEYTDTTSDSDLSIGFDRYMELISHIKEQKYNKKILTTITDSIGHFQFRLLPNGYAGISVLASNYMIAQYREEIKTDYRKAVRYYLDPYKKDADTLYNITVYGKSPSQRETIDIERQQYSSGLTHYLSKVLLTKATIRQVPEAASAMLVRCGSPYDNRYLIAGVPFLSPYHFGGYPYADIDGMMLSTLNKVDVTIDQIAGKFLDASGALIEANPGIYRPADTKLKKRPELAVDLSTISQDILLSFNDKTVNSLQLGYTHSEGYSLKWLDAFVGLPKNAEIGIGSPVGFGNITATGKLKVKNMQSDLFSWFAYDTYDRRILPPVTFPWGMASVKIYPFNHENYSITTGGSHQYFINGIRVGNNSFFKEVYLTNGIFSMKIDSIATKYIQIALNSTLNYQEWNGTVNQRDTFGIDTSIVSSGKEVSCDIQSTLSRKIGHFKIVTNLLVSGVLYKSDPGMIADGGLSFQWTSDHLEAELNFGRITSRPDIRGLPDSIFRQKEFHSYLLSMPVSVRNSDLFKIGIQPYLRYQDKAPQIEPLYQVWQPRLTSSLTSQGIDCDLEVQPFDWLQLYGTVNLSNAYRDDNPDLMYEWNVPYTIRGRLHLIFLNKMLHMYLDGIESKGLPYYDFNEKKYNILPKYRRLDFNLQYRSKILEHRYFTRYDAYFVVSNILDNLNVRNYYWDNSMNKNPIYLLGPMYVEIGLRLGFRL